MRTIRLLIAERQPLLVSHVRWTRPWASGRLSAERVRRDVPGTIRAVSPAPQMAGASLLGVGFDQRPQGEWEHMKRRADHLVTFGLIAVTVFVLLSTFLAPDPASFIRDRYDLLGLLLVSAVAQWRGTRAGVFFAVVTFAVLAVISAMRTNLSPGSSDLLLDLVVFLSIAVVQGVQSGHLRQRELVARENERRMSLLSGLSERLVPTGPSSALNESLKELGDLMKATKASLFLPDERGRLVPQAAGDAEWFSQRPEAAALVSRVFQRCSEWGGIGPCRPEQSDPTHEEGAGAAVPLASPRGPLGVLYVGGRAEGGAYETVELDFLGVTAEVVAAYLEREQLQKAVAEATALESSNRLKSSLVSSISHELKTPLASVTATITGLLEEEAMSDPQSREELLSATQDLRLLDERIGDLLDVSRLEAASWAPNLDWNDPRDVCSSVLSHVAVASRGRIKCVSPSELPIVRFDLVQLSRALYHLIENSLAYAPPDTPIVLGVSSSENHVRFYVEDAGPGVGPEERRVIFEKFRRGRAGSRVPGGTGLGLTIVSEIVRYHGGSIRIEDVEPHGARFVIELSREPQGE